MSIIFNNNLNILGDLTILFLINNIINFYLNIYIVFLINLILDIFIIIKLKNITKKYENPNHIFVEMIISIHFLILHILKLIPLTNFLFLINILIDSIKLSYVFYYKIDSCKMGYYNYIDFYNSNTINFVINAIILNIFTYYFNLINYHLPLGYLYNLLSCIFQPIYLINSNNNLLDKYNLFMVSEYIFNKLFIIVIFIIDIFVDLNIS